jgi:hypothetical protein
MKPRKTFYFNDGIDGVVVAENLKKAIRLLAKEIGVTPVWLTKEIEKGEDWLVECEKTTDRRGLVGWCE